jgi:hypothetical protein
MWSIGTNANRQGSKRVYTGTEFLDMFLFEPRDMNKKAHGLRVLHRLYYFCKLLIINLISAPGEFVGPGIIPCWGQSVGAMAQLVNAHNLPVAEMVVKVVVVTVDVWVTRGATLTGLAFTYRIWRARCSGWSIVLRVWHGAHLSTLNRLLTVWVSWSRLRGFSGVIRVAAI